MKVKFGILFMVIGSVLVLAALGLFLRNQEESQQAAAAVEEVMPQIISVIQQHQQEQLQQEPELEPYIPFTEPVIPEMTREKINGYYYIGFLGLPTLEQELPVMADWSYPKLQISPCRFTGNLHADDLVVMAHNYPLHFGTLNQLEVEDPITFTDMDGITTHYQVVALEVLGPNALEDMTAGKYDLTLFTCTYGGKNRVTVRCDRVEEEE